MKIALVTLAFASGAACFDVVIAHAQSPALTITGRDTAKVYSARDLLADPSVQDVKVGHDPIYQQSRLYRALPVARLLKDVELGPDDYVQVRATDHFSASIPAGLLRPPEKTDTEAFLAIEELQTPGRRSLARAAARDRSISCGNPPARRSPGPIGFTGWRS